MTNRVMQVNGGSTLEILGGLTVNDQVVINPPDSLEEGQEVRVKEIAMNAAGPAPAKPPAPTQGSNKQ